MVMACVSCDHALTPSEQREGWCDHCGKRLPAAGITLAGLARAGKALAIGTTARPVPALAGLADAAGWGGVRAGLGQVLVGVIGQVLLLLLLAALALAWGRNLGPALFVAAFMGADNTIALTISDGPAGPQVEAGPHNAATPIARPAPSGPVIGYFRDDAARRGWEYRYSGPGPWIAGTTFLYRRDFWSGNEFSDRTIGEDADFFWRNPARKVVDLADPRLCVATIHPHNTFARQVLETLDQVILWTPTRVRFDERV